MSIMTQLEFELNFSNSEKQIARYILNHGEDVLSMSAKQLAEATYTSPATIVRLCRKIGLEGYNDFKIKYSAELQYDHRNEKRIDVNFPFSNSDDAMQIAKNLVSLTNEVISDTYQLIDFDELNTIAENKKELTELEDLYNKCLDFDNPNVVKKKFIEYDKNFLTITKNFKDEEFLV